LREIDLLTDWDSIVRRHSEAVLNAAFRVLNHRTDAEDVAQQVFLEAFAKDLHPHSDWGALLRGMAVSRAIDALRRRGRAGSLEVEPPDLKSAAPDQAILLKEEERALRRALAQLAPRDAEVFCLRYFEGLVNEEVASLIGISTSAVAVALSRAKTKLRSVMAPISCEESNV
jgi:RNA polymerase sigma-70 factor (ECF subfamily)